MRPLSVGFGALRLVFALSAGLLLSACQAGGGIPENSALLAGTWQLETIGGQPVVAQSQASLVFTSSELSGNASCNRFFGTYQYSDGVLTIPQLASTKMMCGPSIMAQENDVLTSLSQALQVRVHEDMLHLLDDLGEVLISARRVETDE